MTRQEMSRLDDAVSSCMKCGFCQAVCPVFLGEETTSPRAKVRLAKAVLTGELGLTAGVKRQASLCLNCRSCAAECPSGVEPNRIALAMRADYAGRDGLPLIKRLAFRGALPHPRLAAWGSRLMGVAQHVLALDLQNNPLRHVFPMFGIRKDKDLPSFGRRSLMSLLPAELPPYGAEKARVLYFPGCATNLIYPEIGLSAVNVLRKLGARVILPRELLCCSTPVFSSGDLDGARELARRNLEVFRQVRPDFVVTSCGSCGLTIKQEWSEVLHIDGAEGISGQVLDIAEFVARYVRSDLLSELDGSEVITYHDSCHLRRGMQVYDEPRHLLQSILGSRFVEMKQADRCCGGGGTFCLEHPELSQVVAETKMQCISDSEASGVLTGCPACIMQLRDSAVHRGMRLRVQHTVQLIDKALRSDE